ncbi:MAG: integrase core domain-containing protein [Streptosporangiaceae bacterium]|jgi:hypothetical protein
MMGANGWRNRNSSIDVFLPICGEGSEILYNTFSHVKDQLPGGSCAGASACGQYPVNPLTTRYIEEQPCTDRGMDHAAARNLIMDLGEQTQRVEFMIRDRGSNFTAAFDAVLAGAGIRTVLCNVRTPRMNAIAERWIGGCRRELPGRTLVWNQHHLRRILREYESHHNQHRPHR